MERGGGGYSLNLFTNRMTVEILAMFIRLVTNMETCLFHNNSYLPNSFAAKVQFSNHVQQIRPNLFPPVNLQESTG